MPSAFHLKLGPFMMRTFFVLCIFFCSIIPAGALELSLDDCLLLGVQNDRSLKAYQSNEEARSEDVNIALKSFFPTLKLTGGYTLLDRPNRLIIDADSFGPGMPARDVHLYGDRRFKTASLLLEQPLFTGGKLVQTLNKSKNLEEQARLGTLRQQTLLKRGIGELFFQALNRMLQREVQEKTVRAQKERLRVIKELQTEGYVTIEEILRQEANLSFAEAELFRFQSRENVSLNRLRNALYLDPATELTLKSPDTYQSLSQETQNLETAALANRKDYLAMQQEVSAAEADIKTSQSKLYPQISLYGEYTRQDENNLDRDEIWGTGARLEWSIFEWGKNLAEIRRAKAEKERLQYQREAFAQSIKSETDDLWASLLESEKVTEAWVIKTQASEAMLTQSVDEFAEGHRTLADVLEREAEFIASYNGYLTAVNDQEIALLYLQAAVATPLDPWLIRKPFYRPDIDSQTSRLHGLLSHPLLPPPAPATTPPAHVVLADHGFAIQLGAFANKLNAEQLRKKSALLLEEKPVIVAEIDGTFKVRVTGLENFDEAKAFLPQIKSKLGIAGYIVRTEQ